MMLRFVKLTTGDELIGRIEESDDSYDLRTLVHPLRMLVGNAGYALVQYPAKSLVIDKVHILCDGDVNDELAQLYMERTGGVVTPPKGLVIPH